MSFLRFYLVSSIPMLFLAACGGSDNSTSSQNSDDGPVQLYGAKVAASVANLPTCDSALKGQLFYVLDDQEFRFCSAEGYQAIDLRGANGTDGADGDAGADGSGCSVTGNANGGKTIACADGTTATVSNGASCTVVDKKDGSYGLTCSGTTVTIQDGKDGEDGTGCSLSDDGAGTLTQTCGTTSVSWPKALCGTKAYDPAKQFCGAGTILELCGGLTYDASTHFCDAGTFAPMVAWSTHCLVAGNCGTFKDKRETPITQYKWTKIGTQTWMAENLAYLPSVNAKADYSNTVAMYYVYDYDGTSVSDAKATSNYTTYGVLYNWTAAMAGAASSTASPSGVKGVCPTGWHLPSNDEWDTLVTYVGGSSTAGTKLKSVTGWKTGGDTETDSYGFSALPGGGFFGSYFSFALDDGLWYTATEGSATTSTYSRYMLYNLANVGSNNYDKNYGFSVRCLLN